MSNINMDIRTLRKSIYNEILTKKAVLHHSTYEKLLKDFNKIKGKPTLLKFQAKELTAFNSRNDTFERFKEIKRNKKQFLNNIKDKSNELKNKYKTVSEVQVSENIMSDLRKKLKEFIGKRIMVEYVINDTKTGIKYVKTGTFTVESKYGNWWHKFSARFVYWGNAYDGGGLFEEYDFKGTVFIIPENTFEKFEAFKVKQSFLDGITHCVFTPIKKWAIETGMNCKTKSSQWKYEAIVNKIKKLEEEFKTGLPEDQVAYVCNKLQVDISVDFPLINHDGKYLYAQSMKKRLKHFKFRNTRLNHVELNEVVSMNEFDIVSRDELRNLKVTLDEQKEHYNFTLDVTFSKIFCSRLLLVLFILELQLDLLFSF